MKRLSLLLLFSAIASQTAVTPETGLGQTKSGEQMAAPLFSVTISAPPVVKVGQPFVVKISLTNLSDHPIHTPYAWMGNFDAVYAFEIHDSAGTELAAHAPPNVVFVIGQSGVLDPGKTKVEDEAIQDFYDVKKPGTYEIRVKRCIDLKNPVGNKAPPYDESKGVVWSNKITVTVVPASAADSP